MLTFIRKEPECICIKHLKQIPRVGEEVNVEDRGFFALLQVLFGPITIKKDIKLQELKLIKTM